MKKALLHIFLFTYATMVFKPVLPYISDFIAHICWYSQHMATVHFENGKYHVHAESQEITKKDSPEKSHSTFKKNLSENEYFIITGKYSGPVLLFAKNYFCTQRSTYKSISFHNIFSPPKV